MTGTGLQEYFGVQMNQFDEKLALSTRDIFYWLNQAQDKMVHESKLQYEVDRRIGDILRPFFERESIFTYKDPNISNVDVADLPVNYRYCLSITGSVIYSRFGLSYKEDIVSKPFTVFDRLIEVKQKDDIYRLLLDPFNKSTAKSPICTIDGNKIIIYNDHTFLVSKVFLEYIRNPNPITRHGGTELLPEFHGILVETAVTLFLQNTRELKQRLQRETPLDSNHIPAN